MVHYCRNAYVVNFRYFHPSVTFPPNHPIVEDAISRGWGFCALSCLPVNNKLALLNLYVKYDASNFLLGVYGGWSLNEGMIGERRIGQSGSS